MNIDEMSDNQKSKLLARAMGMRIVFNPTQIVETAQSQESDGLDYVGLNFYSTANMALAWSCLNWWGETQDNESFAAYWDTNDLWLASPAEAQRIWLNRILELAIDARLVPVPEEAQE